jgi:hypothetical protein
MCCASLVVIIKNYNVACRRVVHFGFAVLTVLVKENSAFWIMMPHKFSLKFSPTESDCQDTG